MFEEVAPGVFCAEHRVAEGKNAMVFGARGALAIDAGLHEEEGRAMAEFIRQRGWEPLRLALTHGHGDHVLGARPLAGGEVYAHARTPAVIQRQLPGWARRQGLSEAEMAAGLVWPTITFADELCIDLGGKRVRFFPTPGHSEDGVSAYVEEDRVLVGGDAVVTGIVPAIGDGDSRLLERSLRRLAKMDIEVLVPGHGPVVHGAQAAREWIEWAACYLGRLRVFVRQQMERGLDAEAAARTALYEDFVGARLPADRHNMPGRHGATAARIAAEQAAERQGRSI